MSMLRTRQQGFTILEILLVVLLFGIVVSIAVFSINVTRAQNRDTKRVSDVIVLRSAFTQYWLQKASYPGASNVSLGKPGQNADGLTSDGFVGKETPGTGVIILDHLPLGPKQGEFYTYSGGENGYALRFVTEKTTAYGPAGVYYAHSSGVDQDPEQK